MRPFLIEGRTAVSYGSLWSGTGATDWLGRPVLLDNGATWVAMYRQGSIHGDETASVFHLRFSTDEGATWTDADKFTDGEAVTGAPFTNASKAVSDGILIPAPNGDLLVHIYETTNGTHQFRSTDGGKTWTDEGTIGSDTKIIGGQDWEVVGSDIFITVMLDANSDGSHPFTLAIYKSDDSGATWAKTDVDTGIDTSEAGIISTGGNNLLIVMKDINSATTYKYTSTDLGATWSARVSIGDQLRVLNRPRMRAYNGGIFLYGRDYLSNLDEYTVVWFSDDGGATWVQKFYPDPTAYADCGYCDVLQRANGQYYMLSYAGTTIDADIMQYVFS